MKRECIYIHIYTFFCLTRLLIKSYCTSSQAPKGERLGIVLVEQEVEMFELTDRLCTNMEKNNHNSNVHSCCKHANAYFILFARSVYFPHFATY